MGAALHKIGKPCIVSTKLGPRDENLDPKDKACLRRTVERSLELLHRDVIDILMIHEPDRRGRGVPLPMRWRVSWRRASTMLC